MNLTLEDAQRRGVCKHQRGGVFVHLARQSFEIDAAVGVGLEILHRVAAEGRSGGIGAVGRVGDQDLLARVALRLMPRPHQQNACELAVRASGGLQRDRIHAGDVEQAAPEQIEDFEHALGE